MSEQPTSSSELTRLHEAITATLQEALPRLQNIEAYPVLEEGMKLPALLYAITGMAPGPDPGDGRTCIMATFEALILVEEARSQAPLQAAVLASKLVSVLDEQYWDLDFVDQVQDVQAMPSEATPALLQCVGWSVQWRQAVYLGDTEWPWPDEPPGTLVFAFDPDTGPGNEDQYRAPEDLA
ncbi:hypothetical protein [Pseudomonas sp. Marseille-QA0332]